MTKITNNSDRPIVLKTDEKEVVLKNHDVAVFEDKIHHMTMSYLFSDESVTSVGTFETYAYREQRHFISTDYFFDSYYDEIAEDNYTVEGHSHLHITLFFGLRLSDAPMLCYDNSYEKLFNNDRKYPTKTITPKESFRNIKDAKRLKTMTTISSIIYSIIFIVMVALCCIVGEESSDFTIFSQIAVLAVAFFAFDCFYLKQYRKWTKNMQK